jgi:hypothetical protein
MPPEGVDSRFDRLEVAVNVVEQHAVLLCAWWTVRIIPQGGKKSKEIDVAVLHGYLRAVIDRAGTADHEED